VRFGHQGVDVPNVVHVAGAMPNAAAEHVGDHLRGSLDRLRIPVAAEDRGSFAHHDPGRGAAVAPALADRTRADDQRAPAFESSHLASRLLREPILWAMVVQWKRRPRRVSFRRNHVGGLR